MSTYRSSKRDAAIADEFLDGHMPCMRCRCSAPRSDLAAYGARCEPCYRAYCAEENPATLYARVDAVAALRRMQSGVRPPPLSGARWLRDIEANHAGIMPNGLSMTCAQREFWRTALARELSAEES